MDKRILTLSQYKKALGRSFKKGDTKLPLITIFETIPSTVDYRLLEFVIENYSDFYYKSPYSHSYYSNKVGWKYKPDGTYRLSDHWNFKTNSGLHCRTFDQDPSLNEEKWSIGIWNSKERKFKIILSFPYISSGENKDKKYELKEKYKKENGDKLIDLSNIYVDKLEQYKENMIKLSKFLTNNRNKFDIYLNGRKINADVLNLSTSKIRYIEDGEKNVIHFSRSASREYEAKIFYNNELIIHNNKGKKGLVFTDKAKYDIINDIIS